MKLALIVEFTMETSGCCCRCSCRKSESPMSPPQYLPPPTYWQVLQDVRTGEFSCRTTKPVYVYSSATRWRPPYISYEDHELARIFEKQKTRPPIFHNSPRYYYYSTLRGNQRLPWNQAPPQPQPPSPWGQLCCKYAVWVAWAAATVIGNAVTGSFDGCWVILTLVAALLAFTNWLAERSSHVIASLRQVLKNAAILLVVAAVLGAGVRTYFFVGDLCGQWVADAILLVLALTV